MQEITFTPTQIQILEHLLASKGAISSQFLANGLGISSKTVRKCIDDMQEILMDYGARIDIKPGSGYRLEIQEEEKFKQLKYEDVSAVRIKNNISIQADRAHQVVRYLLTYEGHISIEDLCTLLYINRTSAKKVLARAREILSRFDLSAVFQGRKGLSILGEEKDIRLCLAYEYSYYLTAQQNEGQENYQVMVGENDSVFPEIKKSIISFQNYFEGYNLSSYSIMYIARLIMISKNRNAMKKVVQIDNTTAGIYSNRNTYFVAKMILKQCEKLLDVSFTTHDNILIAMCLVGLRVTLTPPDFYRFGYIENKDTALEIVEELGKINLFATSGRDIQLIEDLSLNLEGILERYEHHILTSQFRLIGYPTCSIMSTKMAMQVANYLQVHKHIHLLPEDVLRLAMIIHPLFGRYPFVFKKFKAAIVPSVDKNEGKGMKERLMRNFGKYMSDIDILEPYELEQVSLNEYQVIFSSLNREQLSLPETMNFIHITLFFDERDKEQIRKQMMRWAGDDEQLYFRVTDFTKVFTKCNPANKEECLKMIDASMKKECHLHDNLYEDLKKCEDILPSRAIDNVVILTGLENHIDNITVNIFVLEKPIAWNATTKTRIVVYWDRGKREVDASRFENEYVPHIIDRFFHNTQFVDEFLKKLDMNHLDESTDLIIGQVMTNGVSFQ